jgi:hypothetical protein
MASLPPLVEARAEAPNHNMRHYVCGRQKCHTNKPLIFRRQWRAKSHQMRHSG